MNRRIVLVVLCSVAVNAPAQAAHIDIVPYFQSTASGYELRAGSFDFNKTANVFDGLPPEPIKLDVLAFTGAFGMNPSNGHLVNGDPGWDLPASAGDHDGFGAEYPPGTLPPQNGTLSFNAIADPRLGRNLSYWNGVGEPFFGPVPGGEVLDIFQPATFGDPLSITLSGANEDVDGFQLSKTGVNPGSFHTHTGHVLWGSEARDVNAGDEPAPGFYLFSLNMEIENAFLMPNWPNFDGAQTIPRSISPTFHVILAHGFENGEDEYFYGDPVFEYLFDENGELVLDENGEPIEIPLLDEDGNQVFEILGVGGFILAPEMQKAVDWTHANLGPAVPEPSAFALTAVLMASMAGLYLRGRLASLLK